MNITRLYPLLLAATGAGALTVAYVAEFGFGLEPCVLCLYERIPYALLALLGFSALRWPHMTPQIFQLAAGVFAAGAALAFYHVGVEQHWWASATGCSGTTLGQTIDTADLLKSLDSKPPKPCDAVDWTVLGVSMAGWNVVFSVLGTGACLYAFKRLKSGREGDVR